MRVYVIRHGESETNLNKKWTGWLDVHLTDKGKDDAKKAGDFLKNIAFEKIYASDLSRAVETAFSFETYYIKLFYSSPRCPIANPAEGDARELHALFDMLKRQFHRERPSKPAIVGLLGALCAMLFEIFSEETAAAKTAIPSRSTCEIIEKAIRYIEQNLCELHDVSQVAEHLHMSRGHFHKLFTRYTGYTPKAFINRCRIVRFLYLSTTYDMTVLDAAMQSGFESTSGFYKTFHSVCGMSPMQYLSQQEK